MNTASPPRRRARRTAWEAGLPARAAALAERWALRGLAPIPGGATGARLFAAEAPQGPAVLKLSLPGQAVRAEADALAGFGGSGAAHLLAADPAEGALLLERLSPGTPLTALAARDDDAATRAAGAVMAALRRPPPPGALLAEAAGWVRLLDRALAGAWPLPRPMLDRAAGLFRDLAASAPAPALLHGDLHHGNILADGPGWRAVDPRGLCGDPAFEAAALLRNPPASPLLRRAPRRLAILAETAGLDRARMAGWAYASAALAACWAIEDGEDPSPWLAAAEALSA
ncbi:aminoglycoside phosphotransferase family protein [Crenalkalicoccus roseus]|uniref:aminoglycoside phosphotransferase family protein n=1 Tax=Crenalkalicoccus roseus TaxID=1485588 RepID=UPI00108052A2|nr:aminoglycoside phosphotransferase family protein [Crenalkalicoccus roseus]